MKLLWERYGKAPRVFTYADFVKTVSDVMDRDMTQFFAKYVAGTEKLPFRDALARIGVAAYDQPFGGEAYIETEPHTEAERQAYDDFIVSN